MNKKSYKKFKVTTKGKEFDTPDGKKNYWNDLGIITLFSESEIPEEVSGVLEMHHMPNIELKIFPIKKKGSDDKAW